MLFLQQLSRSAWPSLASIALCGGAALGQGRREASYREPAARHPSVPVPDGPRLEVDRDFARLADAACSWTPAAGNVQISGPQDGCDMPVGAHSIRHLACAIEEAVAAPVAAR